MTPELFIVAIAGGIIISMFLFFVYVGVRAVNYYFNKPKVHQPTLKELVDAEKHGVQVNQPVQ